MSRRRPSIIHEWAACHLYTQHRAAEGNYLWSWAFLTERERRKWTVEVSRRVKLWETSNAVAKTILKTK